MAKKASEMHLNRCILIVDIIYYISELEYYEVILYEIQFD